MPGLPGKMPAPGKPGAGRIHRSPVIGNLPYALTTPILFHLLPSHKLCVNQLLRSTKPTQVDVRTVAKHIATRMIVLGPVPCNLTHGAPLEVNAHPHMDCTGQIAVIHNGIIENFDELKQELENNGHVFKSKTDTEVIPHLIEHALEINPSISLADAVLETVKKLNGSYAIAVISTREPDKIVCARN